MSQTGTTELFTKELVREVFESISKNEITPQSQAIEAPQSNGRSDELSAFLGNKNRVDEEVKKEVEALQEK